MPTVPCVTRRRWLTHEEFIDLLGATNLIPGPNSTEMAIHVRRARAGLPFQRIHRTPNAHSNWPAVDAVASPPAEQANASLQTGAPTVEPADPDPAGELLLVFYYFTFEVPLRLLAADGATR
jgi:hypothetical protein